jgi:hypothetical protein
VPLAWLFWSMENTSIKAIFIHGEKCASGQLYTDGTGFTG